jgi:hypothetical protein
MKKISSLILIFLCALTTYFLFKLSYNQSTSLVTLYDSNGKEQIIERTNYFTPLSYSFLIITCLYLLLSIQGKMISLWLGMAHLVLSVVSLFYGLIIIEPSIVHLLSRRYYSFSGFDSPEINIQKNKLQLYVLLVVFVLGQYFLVRNVRQAIKTN